jgi:hypothetical protein
LPKGVEPTAHEKIHFLNDHVLLQDVRYHDEGYAYSDSNPRQHRNNEKEPRKQYSSKLNNPQQKCPECSKKDEQASSNFPQILSTTRGIQWGVVIEGGASGASLNDISNEPWVTSI